MEPLKFFDCNCCFGMRSIVDPGSFHKAEDLKKRMRHYGINRALVYHSMAREYNPIIGNNMLAQEIRKNPSFYPLWVVMPNHTGEFHTPAELKRQLKINNVRAVRMFPSQHEQNYSLEPWNCGELLCTLETYRIPLFIGLDQLGFNELHRLCGHYPDLNIVLIDLGYSVDRNLYALLDKFMNLYIETSGYKVHNGIEEICTRFGAHRLIFGSKMPEFSGGAAVSMINYARISDKEKSMIAYENLDKLLGGVIL